MRLAISGKEKTRVAALIANADDRAALSAIATRENWRLQFANRRESIVEELRRSPAVVLCDTDWRGTLEALHSNPLRSRMILVTPETGDKLWLEVLELGGYDVVTRPFHERRLIDAITHAWGELTK
ncbi:MAG: hypothetical protein M3N54_04655 [Acidobacteriota bacterium]|nr:hypothetical protein [Acidobacteriota bacterium]